MSAAAAFVHPMSTTQGHHPPSFSHPHASSPFSHPNPASHAASRHMHPHSQQQQFHTPLQVPPPLQQQHVASTSSPFGGWPAGASSSSSMLPPLAPPQPPAAAPPSFHQHQHRSQQLSQVPPSQQPPVHFHFSQPPLPQPPPPPPQVPPAQTHPYYTTYSHPPYGPPPPEPPEHNRMEMNRDMVTRVLNKFSEELPSYFDLEDVDEGNWGSGGSGDERTKLRRGSKPRAIRLTVHGGACMLLHPGFHALSLKMPEVPHQKHSTSTSRHSPPDASRRHSDPTYVGPRPTNTMHDLARRTSTRDIDIILRGFVADYVNLGPPPPRNRRKRHEGGRAEPEEDISRMDAATRLKACIKATARHFPGLGLDWMNAEADVSLPMAADPATRQTYDPIHTSAWTQNNTHLYTVYTSPNKRLVLTSVPPYWLLAFKLSRWGSRDWADVGIVLRYGTLISRSLFHQDIEWSGDSLRRFLEKECWSMGYAAYDVGKKGVFVSRCEQAAALVMGWEEGVPDGWPERFLDRSLLEGAVEWSGERQMGGESSAPPPPVTHVPPPPPPAVTHAPPPPPDGYRENVRDWVRKSHSRRRRTSSSRRRSRSKSRWRRKEEEEEERFRRDGPFVPPGIEFDPEGYVVADAYREEQEERRGRGRSHRREHYQQQTHADSYAGYTHPYHSQQAQPHHSIGNVDEPGHGSWITDSMARARISSPVQDIHRVGPVDPSLASLAWHPRARAVGGAAASSGGDHSSAVPAMGPSTGIGLHGSSSPYRRQSSPYDARHQLFIPDANQADGDRQRSVMQPDQRNGGQRVHVHDRDRDWDHHPRREYPDSEEEESGGEEEESNDDSDGQSDESESDDSEGDKENRGRGGYSLGQGHSRPSGRRMDSIYAPPTPHPAAAPISRGGSSQSGLDSSLLLQPASNTHLPSGSISGRNAERSPSPNLPKRRPPPLDLSPPVPPPEVLPGPSHGNAGKAARNTFRPSTSTNVHPAYFGGAYDGDHQRQPEASNSYSQHHSQSRRPSPNPPNPSHSLHASHLAHFQAQPPPAHRVHTRQPLIEAQAELPPPRTRETRETREARAAQYQFEQQMREWEQEQRWRRGMGRT